MFRRPSTPNADAVAAARRRLAALAAQFDENSTGTNDAPVGRPSNPSPRSEPDEPPTRPGLADSGLHTVGRHAAVGGKLRRRAEVTPHHVTLTALLVAVAVAIAAWWVLRAAGRAEPVQLSTQQIEPESAATDAPTTAGPGVSPSEPAEAQASTDTAMIVVDVTGKVRHRGIVELPAGSRVIDALNAAGGARRGADLSMLNLARVLIDGEQLVVGIDIPTMSTPTSAGSTSSGDAMTPLNLNTATSEQLEELPGIGPVTAAAIVQWRGEHGAFTSVDELMEVSGIGPATLAEIEAYVYV